MRVGHVFAPTLTSGRRSACFCLLWLLTLFFLREGAWADPARAQPGDVFFLLTRALRAKLHQTYTGQRVILFASGQKRMVWTRIVADIARDGCRSRMTYRFPASVADLTVVDNGIVQRRVQSSCGIYLIAPSAASEDSASPPILALLRRNYRCLWQGMQRVNARQCDRIALHPRFQPGPYRICWIDRASRLILRTEEYDAQGRRRYVSAFTALRFAAHLPDALFLPPPPVGITVQRERPEPSERTFTEACAAAHVAGRAPCWAPPGYRLFHCAVVPQRGKGPALFLRYSDGLKMLCLFEEPLTSALPPVALQQRMLDDQLGRYGQQAWVQEIEEVRVTLVGDSTLPPSIGAEMMRALSPESERRLRRALARDFGASGAAQSLRLRRKGWGYDQIAAGLLRQETALPSRQVEERASAWIAAALAVPKE